MLLRDNGNGVVTQQKPENRGSKKSENVKSFCAVDRAMSLSGKAIKYVFGQAILPD